VVASGATIGGERRRVQTNMNWEGFGWAGKLAWWLAVSASTLVVGLVLVWLAGRGILRVLALIPILGGLVWFAAVVVGLGALAVAIWRARNPSPTAPATA
jgi:hypothetical protein